MSNGTKLEDKIQSIKQESMMEIKKSIFDVVAAAIILAIIMVSMNVIGLIDLKNMNFFEFLVEWLPFLAAALLLNSDLYKKGVFVGKRSDQYISIGKLYSEKVNSLTGEQIEGLYPFCEEYNRKALQSIQDGILRAEGITYEHFDGPWQDAEGVPHKSLKTCTKQDLIALKFNTDQIKAIRKAKRVRLKGINVNVLLSSINIKDPTNIGSDEKQLEIRQTIFSSTKYVFSTLLMSFIAVRDVTEWGWLGLIVVVFKIAYTFAGCYMSYFKGYDNITIRVCNHIARKCDILKMYLKNDKNNYNS